MCIKTAILAVYLMHTHAMVQNSTNTVGFQAPKGYDRTQRPGQLSDTQDNVTNQVEIINVGPVNDKDMHFHVDIFFRQWWHDERLHDLRRKKYVFSDEPGGKIWIPDTHFILSIYVKEHKVPVPNIRVIINPNGDIYVSRRLSLKIYCNMYLTTYPMDTQVCSLLTESYSFPKKQLQLYWTQDFDPVLLLRPTSTFTVEGYTLGDIVHSNHDHVYSYINIELYSQLQVKFYLHRNFNHYLFHLYIPSMILVALTFSSFWIPHTAYPARVTLCVTNFLATMLFVQTVTKSVNIIAEMNAMEIFLSTNLLFIFLTLIEYCFVINTDSKKVLKLYGKILSYNWRKKNQGIVYPATHFVAPLQVEEANSDGNNAPSLPKDTKKIVEYTGTTSDEQLRKESKKENKSKVHAIDRICKFLFPMAYVIVITIYFGRFLHLWSISDNHDS